MANDNTILPVDHSMDPNIFLSKDYDTENPDENQPNLFQLTFP